ncbi:hypothetical protein RGU72_20710 [Undibacterium sp. 5I1]|uniref:hypothetical protein n=1 Tax=Undibacterium sp. 5I1 TaxID=3048590 RepID=UPI002AB43AD0|nr:hypothetical protein [Undibacterium sp. 5I1]MDY7540679.1 hypothetical protein [Undibacterium sp. 5I1]
MDAVSTPNLVSIARCLTPDTKNIHEKSQNLEDQKADSVDRLTCALEVSIKTFGDVSEKLYLSQKQIYKVLRKNVGEQPLQTLAVAFALGYFARYLFKLKE